VKKTVFLFYYAGAYLCTYVEGKIKIMCFYIAVENVDDKIKLPTFQEMCGQSGKMIVPTQGFSRTRPGPATTGSSPDVPSTTTWSSTSASTPWPPTPMSKPDKT
jgi:hypothetical protein